MRCNISPNKVIDLCTGEQEQGDNVVFFFEEQMEAEGENTQGRQDKRRQPTMM